MVKWTLSDLVRERAVNVEFDEDVDIDASSFDQSSLINDVKDVHISGRGILDESDNRFYVKLNVTGIMLVPDAVTGEEIEFPFDTETDEVYAFDETSDDGVRVVTNEVIDLLPAVIDNIMLEVPIQVTNASSEDYPHGDGWQVYTEEEYEKSQGQRIDPRLAKLKEFKEE